MTDAKTCSSCGSNIAGDSRFCPQCGTPQALSCAACGHANAAGSRFCAQCGAKLGGAAATSTAAPAAAAPSWPPAEVFWLQAGAEGAAGMMLEFGLSAALVAELRAGKIEATKATVDSSSPVPPPDSGQGTGALDRLMDVQLAVTMRFGARQLLLREVLDLSPGAVVELDRRVQEPVDLLLDGRLLARGEVVVIDGNYGLRVTDVSPLGPAMGRHEE